MQPPSAASQKFVSAFPPRGGRGSEVVAALNSTILNVRSTPWSCTGLSRRVVVDEVLKTFRRDRGTARRQDCIGELDEELKTSLPWAGDRYCGNCAALPYNVSELGIRLAASGVVPKRAWKLPVMPLRPVLPLRVEVVCQ